MHTHTHTRTHTPPPTTTKNCDKNSTAFGVRFIKGTRDPFINYFYVVLILTPNVSISGNCLSARKGSIRFTFNQLAADLGQLLWNVIYYYYFWVLLLLLLLHLILNVIYYYYISYYYIFAYAIIISSSSGIGNDSAGSFCICYWVTHRKIIQNKT